MKKIVLFILLMGSMVSCKQEDKEFYKTKSLKEWLADYKKNKSDMKAMSAIRDYHKITEDKFIGLTNGFWTNNGEMEYLLLDKNKVDQICALKKPPANFKYIKFDPTSVRKIGDVKLNVGVNYPTLADFDRTNSSYLITLFEILDLEMGETGDVILLTKGIEFICVPKDPNDPTDPPTVYKPYTYKECTVVLFKTVNAKGEATGYYDISHDPGF